MSDHVALFRRRNDGAITLTCRCGWKLVCSPLAGQLGVFRTFEAHRAQPLQSHPYR